MRCAYISQQRAQTSPSSCRLAKNTGARSEETTDGTMRFRGLAAHFRTIRISSWRPPRSGPPHVPVKPSPYAPWRNASLKLTSSQHPEKWETDMATRKAAARTTPKSTPRKKARRAAKAAGPAAGKKVMLAAGKVLRNREKRGLNDKPMDVCVYAHRLRVAVSLPPASSPWLPALTAASTTTRAHNSRSSPS